MDVKNPFNPAQVRKVSLLPPSAGNGASDGNEVSDDCAEVFAFWTRDPGSILEHAEELEKRGWGFYVMTTLTAYPPVLEPNVPPPEEIILKMKLLADKISADKVMWRYDPVFLSDLTSPDFHRRNFAYLAARLRGTVNRVIVSVYDEYPAAEKRLAVLEQRGMLTRIAHYEKPRPGSFGGRSLTPELRALLAEFACIAHSEGMEIQSCAEEDLSDCKQPDCIQSGDSGIRSGACIDGEYISRIFGVKVPGKDKGQRRPHCLCAQSVDIGAYGNCPAGCVYCYGLRTAFLTEKPSAKS